MFVIVVIQKTMISLTKEGFRYRLIYNSALNKENKILLFRSNLPNTIKDICEVFHEVSFSSDEKEFAKKMRALACGATGLVNFISVGFMIFCTLFF